MPKSTNPLAALRRSSSSPFSTAPRRKNISRQNSASTAKATSEETTPRLNDVGFIPSLPIPEHIARHDLIALIRHIQESAFDEMPDRAAGMNSTRISEILRFHAALPPIVSVAHLHALSASPTQTERELARLIAQGVVRKVVIPGRGKGGAAVGEGVVLVEVWEQRVRDEAGIDEEVKETYCRMLREYPASATTSTTSLASTDVQTLVQAGFLTSPGGLSANVADVFARPRSATDSAISRAGFTAATGTLAAVGGHDAVHANGGSGSSLATKDRRLLSTLSASPPMTLSLPSTGIYLRLLTEARQHLLHLLKQLSPRHREGTADLLKEKWSGNVLSDPISHAKRSRGDWSGVLPGKTKRWREFYGMRFDFVLAECVGAGLVELFDTASVGMGVRAM